MTGKWAIWLIITLAFFLRLWGINFGLPAYRFLVDENHLIDKSLKMLLTGDFNPHWFGWPSLVIYLQMVLFLPVFLAVKIAYGTAAVDNYWPVFAFLGRLASVLSGTASVFLTYKLGEKIAGKKIGLLACLVMAVIFPHVVYSHYATTDITAVFLGTLSLIFCLKIFIGGKSRDYLLAGLFVGLANAAKYNPFYIFPLLAAHYFKPKEQRRGKNLLLGLTASAVGFLIGVPYLLIDWGTFWSREMGVLGLIYHIKDLEDITVSNANGLSTPQWWLEYLLISGLTPLVFLFALAGLFFAFFHKSRREIIIILTFFLPYSLSILFSPVRFDRYILPLTPAISVLTAISLSLIKIKKVLLKPWILALLFFVLIGCPLSRGIIFDWLISQKDTRQLANEWLVAKVSREQEILSVGSAITVSYHLREQGFWKVKELFPLETDEVFRHSGALLIITGHDFHTAENYRGIKKFAQIWANYDIIRRRGTLVKKFSQNFFESGFFGPHHLEHSLTVNGYHQPTVEMYLVPTINKDLE